MIILEEQNIKIRGKSEKV